MSEPDAPKPPAVPPVPTPKPVPERRWMRALALTLAPLLLFFALVSAGIGWVLNDEQGSRWLLRVLPGVTATGTSGSLLGEFSAERVEIVLTGAAPAAAHPDRIVIHGLSWSGVGLEWPVAMSSWARVRVDRVQADRVDVQVVGAPDAPPLALPASLTLPIELDLHTLRVGTVHVAALGEEPLRDLEARLQLGADGGASHRADGVAFAWDRVRVRGNARIGTASPFGVDARLALSPREMTPREIAPGETQGDSALAGFDATLTLAGPLDTLALKADLRGSGRVQGAAAQSLALEATLKPFAPWPLATLAAQTQALDLAALYSGAPRTALSGTVTVDSVASDRPATIDVKLDNARAGRNDEGLLPVRSLRAELRARPDDVEQVEIKQLALELGTLRERGGSVTATGHWTPTRAVLDASFSGIAPQALDARAPPMRLGGSARLQADDWFAPNATTSAAQREPVLALRARIEGELPQGGQTHKVQLDLDASATPRRIVLRQAALQAGAARAEFAGQAQQQARGGWQVKGGGRIEQFNPALWWRGADGSAWQSGVHRLNGNLDVDLLIPANVAAMTLAQLARSQGQATLHITDSELAGTPLAGELTLRGEGAAGLDLRGQIALASADADIKGRFAADANDHWEIELHAPDLAPLAPVLQLGQTAGTAKRTLAGALDATTRIDGRWPSMRSQGSLTLKDGRLGDSRLERATARWTFGTLAQAPLDLQIELTQGSVGARKLDSLTLAMQGTTAEHRVSIDAASPVRPPSWVDTLHGAAPRATRSTGTRAELRAKGTLKFDLDWRQPAQWSLQLQQLQALRRGSNLQTPWFSAKGFDVVARYDPLTSTPQLDLTAGRAELTNMALRWSALRWRGGEAPALDVQAEVEPFSVAPLMARMQPEFGWSGDLVVGGKIDIHSAPSFVADIEFGRRSGDLSVTDEVETHKLELTDLRIALDAKDGVWNFTHALAGRTLGAMAGAATVRTNARAIWPPADAPLQGVMELRIDDLAAWGAWVPAGWRLRGALHASASFGGLFGAPEFTGKVEGSRLGLRNLLEGIDLHEGELEVALQGETAKIVKLQARGGDGKLEVSGGATFGESPRATLRVVADKLLVLGRVDRQIVASGDATLKLDPKRLAVAGHVNIDKGLIDLSRGGAPTLASDVTVLREPTPEQALTGSTAAAGGREVDVELMLNLGQALRLRGRGLDTLLRGELKLTTPGGRLALQGTLNATRGTYAAYNQKLEIERGAVIFNGPPDNPRLDILALRPNLDMRVGVAVTGTAAAPRISLYSEPDLPDSEKLSWLVLGRAPDGLGGSDIALLQAAAAALLAGEGDSPSAQLTQLIGLDTLSVRQIAGDVRDTVVSVGKQLSRRWYVGYERSLSSTAGNWQLIYRLAQRFTLRLQTGIDNSIDLIWTWRWD